MEGFKHKSLMQIRFSDVDAFGHVNNACYLTYIEEARIKYFNDLVNWAYDWSKQGVILARAEVDFIVPIKFSDEIAIYTRCVRIGNKSFDLQYRMMKKQGDKDVLMADSTTVMVAFDYVNQKSISVPAEWRAAIQRYEEGNVK